MKLIREFTEFSNMRLNQTGLAPMGNVPDIQGMKQYDRHINNLKQSMVKINDILANVRTGLDVTKFRNDALLLEQQLESLSIIRITRNNLVYDVFFKATISDKEYWGIIRDILGERNVSFEAYRTNELVKPKEWIIRTNGILIKSIMEFLKPEPGIYRLLNNEMQIRSNESGKIYKLIQNDEFELLRAFNDHSIIRVNNEKYTLRNDNFIYFPYWTEKKEL